MFTLEEQTIIKKHYLSSPYFEDFPTEGLIKYENSSCGDFIYFSLNKENIIGSSIRFKGDGCSLSLSATSLMIQELQELKSHALKIRVQALLEAIHLKDYESLGSLRIFRSILEKPVRIKCLTLPLESLLKELNNA